ncbi:unnamed protein product [Lymnaea stagnalis]|uniref:Uncharacterized protein n=1 Tax=Lymnaea stagnalis TaxID=6523 RepID=A0AAV2HDD8_LYMST
MYLSPSQVHFTSCIDSLGASKMAADSHISDVYREMRMQRCYPRLQVVKKCGYYFTLDNTRLYMLRRMEEEGHCKLVLVDQVLLKKVPEAVQDMMVPPSDVPAPQIRKDKMRFRLRLRRASEQPTVTTPHKCQTDRDTKSVTCSLETGRRKFTIRNQDFDYDSDSSMDEKWQDETVSLL